MAHLVGYRMPQDLRMGSDTLFRILFNPRVINGGIDPAVAQSTPNDVFARFAGISLILTANRLGGHGSMQIGLASASEIERGQLSPETATPVWRKIRIVSSSAAVRICGATEAQLYTCTVRSRLICAERART